MNGVIDGEENEELYSKKSIILMSTIFSPLVGAIIYCSNLRKIDKKNFIASSIISSIIYIMLMNKMLHGLESYKIFALIPLNFLGGLIITNLFWKHHIGELKFNPIFPWSIFVITSLILTGVVLISLYFSGTLHKVL